MREGKPRILVVEGNPLFRPAAREFFELLGKFTVDFAETLDEGLKKLEQNDYFLGIFSLHMPAKVGDDNDVQNGGLELGRAAEGKANMFYVYYEGEFDRGMPRTRYYLYRQNVLQNIPDGDTHTKHSIIGWEELYMKLVRMGQEIVDQTMLQSIDQAIKKTRSGWRLPTMRPKKIIPFIIDKYYDQLTALAD